MATRKHVLLTGLPGVGKTTVIRNVVQSLWDKHELQTTAMGFYTEELRAEGRRVGFDVVTLGGTRSALARIGEGRYMVGRYCVDIASFEQTCLPELAPKRDTKLIVVDEIGKMEVFSEAFVEAVAALLDGGPMILGVIPLKSRNAFIDAIKLRSNVDIFTVTEHNRVNMPKIIHDAVSTRIGEQHL